MTDTAILERNTAGLQVEIHWLPTDGSLVLTVDTTEASEHAAIAADRVRDAFDHPTLYLDDRQVARLFPRTSAPE